MGAVRESVAAPGEATVPDYAARFPDLAGDLPRTLGQYVLLDRVGAGAMGTVYRAVHLRMKREVAVKVLRAEAGDPARLAGLFDREIRAAACLVGGVHGRVQALPELRAHRGDHVPARREAEHADLVRIEGDEVGDGPILPLEDGAADVPGTER